MANPLARIVMENIAKKANITDSQKNTEYPRREDIGKASDIGLKSLDRLADQVRGFKEDKNSDSDKSVISDRVKSNRKNNLSREELSLISGLIAGEIDTANSQRNRKMDPASSQRDLKTSRANDIWGGRKDILSLDKLAKNIKNGI